MSVNIDDKFKMFQNLLMEKIHNENEEEIAKLSRVYDQELTSSQNKIQKQAKKILHEAEITAKLETKNQLQKAIAERNKQVLFLRKQFTEELFRLLREKISDMPQEQKKNYLKESILQINKMFADEDELVFKTDERDYAYADQILAELKKNNEIKKDFSLTKINIGGLGGIVAENKDATLRADFSIASFLEENRDLIGRRIQTSLNEVMNIELE